MPFVTRQRTVSRMECLNNPRTSDGHYQIPSQVQTIHSKSSIGGTPSRRSNPQEYTLNPDPLVRLIERKNEDKMFIDEKPVIAIWGIGSEVTHISHEVLSKTWNPNLSS